MTTQPRSRWFRFAFGLRTLFVVVTIFGVWLGIQVTHAHEQRAAVAAIRAAVGNIDISYDYETDESGFHIPDAKPPGPEWLRKLVGIDYFATVESVAISKFISSSHGQTFIGWQDFPDFTDQNLNDLKKLRQLRWLDLTGTGITDAGLENLSGLTQLVELDVTETAITTSGIRKLSAALPNLAIKTKQPNFTVTIDPMTGQQVLTLPNP